MSAAPVPSPEAEALRQVVLVGMGMLLTADLAFLAVVTAGWIRGRSLLARRWSSAHVLVVFQACLLLTLVVLLLVGLLIGVALGLAGADGNAERPFADDR